MNHCPVHKELGHDPQDTCCCGKEKTTTTTDWESDFDLRFPEGERREYDSYPYPLRETEREEIKAFFQDTLVHEIAAAEQRGRDSAVEYIEQNPGIQIKALDTSGETLAIVLEKGGLPADFLLTSGDALEAARKAPGV